MLICYGLLSKMSIRYGLIAKMLDKYKVVTKGLLDENSRLIQFKQGKPIKFHKTPKF